MKKEALIALLSLVAIPVMADQTVWYGGDNDDRWGLVSMYNGQYANVVSLDDFTWNSPDPLTGVFGTMVASYEPQALRFEIRDGVREGFGGTLVASGKINAPNYTDLGTWALGSDYHLYLARASVGPVFLTQGHTYFVGIQLDGLNNQNNLSGVVTTSGTNGVGSPIHNGNSFQNSPPDGVNYIPIGEDLSYGVTAVPEPSCLVIVGLAGLLIRKRHLR